jgi:WD40 repeat protein
LIDQPFDRGIAGFALSLDRRFLATGGAEQWVLYDLEENAVLLDIRDIHIDPIYDPKPYIFGLAFNPDASRVATLQVDGVITIWDTRTGKRTGIIEDIDQAVSWLWG